jgi:hypothetical protein
MSFEVWNPRFAGFLNKIFQGRGGRGGAPLTVLDDILPTINMVDPGEFENHFGRGEIPFAWGAAVAAAGALQYSYGFVSNPVGSQSIAVIERITVSGATLGMNVVTGWSSVFIGGGAFVSTDGRAIQGSPPGLQGGTSSAAALLATSMILQYCPVSGTAEEIIAGPPCGVVLIPGQTWMVQGVTANQGFDVNVSGYSRIAEPGELSA